jgi:hypothetical protein
MFHRVVSLLLVPTLFLQGMGVCHSQGGTCLHEPAGHEEAPHFHLCIVGLYHHAHEDHHADQDGKPKGHNEHALAQQVPTLNHDDDAVYVSALVMLGRRSGYSQVASGDYSALLVTIDAMVGSPPMMALSRLLAHPLPSLLCHHCPIYLRTLALFI